MASLLAVDLGVRSGLAVYGEDGRLKRYRSVNFGSRGGLKRAAYGVVAEIAAEDELSWLVAEGDRALAEIWSRLASKRGARSMQIGAEVWRAQLLFRRERRSGSDAKQHADRLAREIIAWSEAPAPTSLRHDAAEAILIGFWGVLEVGWLGEVPDALARGGLTAQGPFGAVAAGCEVP